jgi:hypothetical protein
MVGVLIELVGVQAAGQSGHVGAEFGREHIVAQLLGFAHLLSVGERQGVARG